jgi:hypothetical protein
MKNSLQRLLAGMNGTLSKGTTANTAAFRAFANLFRKEFTDELATIKATLIEYKVGHFYVYGMFQLADKSTMYFSLPDVRQWSAEGSYYGSLLFRKAKTFRDTTGENQFTKIFPGMAKQIELKA